MTTIRHVVVGPGEHGVVRHAWEVATACGHDVVHRGSPDEVLGADLAGADVVHIPFTDRLFGSTCEQAAEAFGDLAAMVAAGGAALSVTLHDLPSGDSPRARRRHAAYRAMVAGVRGLVVSSRHEMSLASGLGDTAWSRRVVPLPVDRLERPSRLDEIVAGSIGILGFQYPGKGIEDVLTAAPEGATVLGLGGLADGHDDQQAHLASCAASAGTRWRTTGFLPDEELPAALAGVAVPVAPHRHVSASGSIATWIAHGRRPLVPDIPYTREIDHAWPGTVRRYAAERPGALGQELARAMADPPSTVIGPLVGVGPGTAEVARLYRDHLEACAPPTPLRLGTRWTVPGNRWDLLEKVPDPEPPTVSVVVPYYNAQDHLDLVLTALSRQTHPASRLEVVVADDGSVRPPRLDAAGPLEARSVHQDDRGFRAAAARNLGARAAAGDVVAFLDGDTVPEPEYLAALSRLPALTTDAVVVGRRRHAEASSIRDWLAGTVHAPDPLPEPAWLAEAYAASDDLLNADERSYRYVISAVLAMHRALWEETGGFCEEFRTYGGEDWELASRAWHAGALLAHVPEAVAWHAGPDWVGRGGDPAAKEVERRMLDRLLPDPVDRTGGDHRYPATVVIVASPDPHLCAAAVAAVRRRGLDAGVWWPESSGRIPAGSPVRPGRPPHDVLARAGVLVRVTGDAGLADLLVPDRHGVTTSWDGTAHRRRALARVARADVSDPDRLLDRLFGHRDVP